MVRLSLSSAGWLCTIALLTTAIPVLAIPEGTIGMIAAAEPIGPIVAAEPTIAQAPIAAAEPTFTQAQLWHFRGSN
jgi:hypothetical protein